ncbi:hypothetical protein BDB01DRAFT_831013 [Pilobolus umbonatus]|nr:hypothetical protein BDB01DRAFT_831013 [Pilobolus umbonatus]
MAALVTQANRLNRKINNKNWHVEYIKSTVPICFILLINLKASYFFNGGERSPLLSITSCLWWMNTNTLLYICYGICEGYACLNEGEYLHSRIFRSPAINCQNRLS